MKEDQYITEDSQSELIDKIQELNDLIRRQTSWKFIWVRGIVLGIAGAVGASVIAGIILAILGAFFSAADLPTLQNVVEDARSTITE